MDSNVGLIPAPAVLQPRAMFVSSVEGLVLERTGRAVQATPMAWLPLSGEGRVGMWGTPVANEFIRDE